MNIQSKIDFKNIPVKGDLKESVQKYIASNGFKPAPNRKVSVDVKVNVTELRKFKIYLDSDGRYVEKEDLLKACNKIKFPGLKGYKVKFVYKDVAPKKKKVVKAPTKKVAPKKAVAKRVVPKKKVAKKASSNKKK